jgi:hypothetical protein
MQRLQGIGLNRPGHPAASGLPATADRRLPVSRRAALGGACGGLLLPALLGRWGAAAEPTSPAGRGHVPDIIEARDDGLVEVRYIHNDSRSAQVIVTNVSHRPVTIRLPDAFAGVPVLAQMGGNNQQAGAGFGAGGIGAQPQTTGAGGLGGQGMNGMGQMGGFPGGGGGGGAFSIPPERRRVIRVRSVCLEHGKPDPRPQHRYTIERLESFSSDARLAIVLEALGKGEIPQKVAQAAAWHLANGLTWQRLAAEKIDHVVDPDEPYFSPQELRAAAMVVDRATTLAADRQPAASSGSGS